MLTTLIKSEDLGTWSRRLSETIQVLNRIQEKTKKISRKRLAKSILLSRIFADIELLESELVTDDMVLMDDAIAKLRSLLLRISQTEKAAEKLIERSDNPLVFENLVRFHLQFCPEDVHFLHSYVKT